MDMKNTQKLTLKEVARQLNVSTATISNTFRRPDQLSVELRENILKRCEKIGYYGPSATAHNAGSFDLGGACFGALRWHHSGKSWVSSI